MKIEQYCDVHLDWLMGFEELFDKCAYHYQELARWQPQLISHLEEVREYNVEPVKYQVDGLIGELRYFSSVVAELSGIMQREKEDIQTVKRQFKKTADRLELYQAQQKLLAKKCTSEGIRLLEDEGTELFESRCSFEVLKAKAVHAANHELESVPEVEPRARGVYSPVDMDVFCRLSDQEETLLQKEFNGIRLNKQVAVMLESAAISKAEDLAIKPTPQIAKQSSGWSGGEYTIQRMIVE